MPPQIVPSSDQPGSVTCEAVVVTATTADDGPALGPEARALDDALDGHLASNAEETSFKGKVGEIRSFPTLGRLPAKHVVLLGIGRGSAHEIRRATGGAARRLSEHAVVAAAFGTGAGETRAAAEGFLLGSYSFIKYKTDPKRSKIERVLLLGDPPQDAVERGVAMAEATILARDLTNEPAAILTPDALARRCREMCDVTGLECTVWEERELQDKGFGGILGVAQGSSQPPRFIQMRYTPEGTPAGKIALVGKGITFDSGGLSLKDAKNMETMKTDMAGSAAVVGAMSALSRIRPNVEVLAFISTTENMPGPAAIKPGDVITHYGGHTSEVLNTDAEGRLVLADAIAFACEQQPDAIVDVATLTGAMMVALGRKVIGYFASDDVLATEISDAADRAGERIWRLPLLDDYRADIDSEIADVKNTGTRYGGAIYGALFVRDFLAPGIPWAHLDIAGPARAEGDHEEVIRGGTGVAARTLVEWIEGRAG